MLTSDQLATLQQDVQTAQANGAGQYPSGTGAPSSTSTSTTATLPNGLTLADIQNQATAAATLLLRQLAYEVGYAG